MNLCILYFIPFPHFILFYPISFFFILILAKTIAKSPMTDQTNVKTPSHGLHKQPEHRNKRSEINKIIYINIVK